METEATILMRISTPSTHQSSNYSTPRCAANPSGGGVVLAASYEAKSFAVSGGMSGWRARELCPQLIFVGGHFQDYQTLGDAALKVLGDFTPLVERISIDEAFADVAGCTHLFDSSFRVGCGRIRISHVGSIAVRTRCVSRARREEPVTARMAVSCTTA